jgi:hypothetical protein
VALPAIGNGSAPLNPLISIPTRLKFKRLQRLSGHRCASGAEGDLPKIADSRNLAQRGYISNISRDSRLR